MEIVNFKEDVMNKLLKLKLDATKTANQHHRTRTREIGLESLTEADK